MDAAAHVLMIAHRVNLQRLHRRADSEKFTLLGFERADKNNVRLVKKLLLIFFIGRLCML